MNTNGASAIADQALVASPSNPQAVSTEGFDPSRTIALPESAGWCAWDSDECWVMVAVDSAEEVDALLNQLKPRHRIRLADEGTL